MDQFAQEKEEATLKTPVESGVDVHLEAQGDLSIKLEPGRLVAERYKVISLIGQGAMGAVYEVEQVFLKKRFALKTLNSIASSDVAARRFQKEAHAASKLEHPNLVRAYDFGLIDGSQPYFIMDLLSGVSLAEHLKQVGRLTVESALKIFIPVCNAMAYAHQQGVVHRDIKPGNIMLAHNPLDAQAQMVPKIVDFGIAKLELSDEFGPQALTKTGDVFGTPLYMSPEQCMGNKIDKRSDIYSLGCVLFEALTGAPPFTGTSALETMMQHNSAQAPSLKEASVGLDFPPYLEKIIAKMLAKNPDDRYQDCGYIISALAALQDPAEQERLMKAEARSLVEDDKHGDKKPAIARSALPLTIALAVIAGAATFYVWTSSHRRAEQPVKNTAAKPLEDNRFSMLVSDTIEKNDELDTSNAPFRSDGKSEWIFNFGPKKLGQFAWTPDSKTGPVWKSAVGTIKTPKEGVAFFKVYADALLNRPNLLERVRDGDLFDLEVYCNSGQYLMYNGNDDEIENALSYAHHLKSLRSLRLSSTPVGMRGLNNIQIQSFTKLERLYLRNTSVDGKELAKLKILPQLKELDVTLMSHANAALRPLTRSQNLTELEAESDKLTNADLSGLAGSTLKSLDLANNPGITDRGVAIVKDLPDLLALKIDQCSITPAVIDCFAPGQKLSTLEITVDRWRLRDVLALHKRLPKTRLKLFMHAGTWSADDLAVLRSLPDATFEFHFVGTKDD